MKRILLRKPCSSKYYELEEGETDKVVELDYIDDLLNMVYLPRKVKNVPLKEVYVSCFSKKKLFSKMIKTTYRLVCIYRDEEDTVIIRKYYINKDLIVDVKPGMVDLADLDHITLLVNKNHHIIKECLDGDQYSYVSKRDLTVPDEIIDEFLYTHIGTCDKDKHLFKNKKYGYYVILVKADNHRMFFSKVVPYN